LEQFCHISGTHAYVLITIREIQPGEEITVGYTREGYYHIDSTCGCKTCNPSSDPALVKRASGSQEKLPSVQKKRHRSGRKHHRMKKVQGHQAKIK